MNLNTHSLHLLVKIYIDDIIFRIYHYNLKIEFYRKKNYNIQN